MPPLHSLPFEVDYFHPRPGRKQNPEAYFLTHAHTDHLIGLETFSHPVYCSAQTAIAAQLRSAAPASIFRPLSYHKRTLIENKFRVTLLPTFHCYGAAMLYFEGPFGTVLHTGDFRATDEVVRSVRGLKVDTLILDCTYCHPEFEFPSVQHATEEILNFIEHTRNSNSKKGIIIAADGFGKEELFISIAQRTNTKIIVDPQRYQLIQAVNPKAITYFIAQDYSADNAQRQPTKRARLNSIRVVPYRSLIASNFASLSIHRAIVIAPTAHDKRVSQRSVHFRYSSHSSFSELRRFVQALRPKDVYASPETAVHASDGRTRDPRVWFADLLPQKEVVARKRGSVPSVRCAASVVFQRAAGVRKASGVRFKERRVGKKVRTDGTWL